MIAHTSQGRITAKRLLPIAQAGFDGSDRNFRRAVAAAKTAYRRDQGRHTTTASLLDRLLHHAVVIVTDGESYRMRIRGSCPVNDGRDVETATLGSLQRAHLKA